MASSPRAVVRSARSRAWLTARRLGVVPSGQPDRLGEDSELLGSTLPHRVMVFFPDPPGSLYQLEQWYPTLRVLDAELGVVVVLQDSRTARAVRERSGLDAIVVAESTTIDDLLLRGPVAVCLYVNHNPANFTNLRLGQLVHVSLMHGDSDKSVSVSNQLKAYDYAFVAGQAAVDRVAASVAEYDAAARCHPVGRPQIDELLEAVDAACDVPGDDARTAVLYAPTWEGPQPTAAYGSVATHGEALVRSLLDAGRFRVVYRPHPLTGVRSSEYAAADARIRALVTEAAGGGHRVDVGVPVARSFADADLLVCDISGVAVDWLALDRPLVITEPADPRAWQGESPLREAVPGLPVGDAARFSARVGALMADDGARLARERLAGYYLGEVAPGAATKRFVAACHDVIRRRSGDARAIDTVVATSAADEKGV